MDIHTDNENKPLINNDKWIEEWYESMSEEKRGNVMSIARSLTDESIKQLHWSIEFVEDVQKRMSGRPRNYVLTTAIQILQNVCLGLSKDKTEARQLLKSVGGTVASMDDVLIDVWYELREPNKQPPTSAEVTNE